MKRYIKASFDDDVIVNNSWPGLIRDIRDYTSYDVDPSYAKTPQKFIYLIDEDGNECEAEVTQYSNGDYELRLYNIHPTGGR